MVAKCPILPLSGQVAVCCPLRTRQASCIRGWCGAAQRRGLACSRYLDKVCLRVRRPSAGRRLSDLARCRSGSGSKRGRRRLGAICVTVVCPLLAVWLITCVGICSRLVSVILAPPLRHAFAFLTFYRSRSTPQLRSPVFKRSWLVTTLVDLALCLGQHPRYGSACC